MPVFAVVGANIGNGVVVLAGAGLGELVALSVEVGVVMKKYYFFIKKKRIL